MGFIAAPFPQTEAIRAAPLNPALGSLFCFSADRRDRRVFIFVALCDGARCDEIHSSVDLLDDLKGETNRASSHAWNHRQAAPKRCGKFAWRAQTRNRKHADTNDAQRSRFDASAEFSIHKFLICNNGAHCPANRFFDRYQIMLFFAKYNSRR
jgi:hypothetical protein